MTTALAERTETGLTAQDARQEVKRAIGWTRAQLSILLETVVPAGTSLAAVVAFAYVCKRTGLDPFARQIYLINYGGKPTAVTGIDGHRLTAHRSGYLAGSDAPRHEGMVKEEVLKVRSEKRGEGWVYVIEDTFSILRPTTTYVTVHKDLGGARTGKFVGVVDWVEFARYDVREVEVDGKRKKVKALRDAWANGPKNMLAKCAEAQANRKVAPAELSGIYTDAELDIVIDVVGRPVDAKAAALPAPQAAPAATSAAAGERRAVNTGKDFWNVLMDHVGGNAEEAQRWLARCSEFKTDKGETRSARDYVKMSDSWAKKSYARFLELTTKK